jgi:hypothetical protein
MFEKLIDNNINQGNSQTNEKISFTFTKVELKKKLKEYLQENKDKNTLLLLNENCPEVLKFGLINKYSINFPLDNVSLNKLSEQLNIKKLVIT